MTKTTGSPHDAQYTTWLERYRRAWVDRDAVAAGRLFTDDAIYREQPFEPPMVGRAAIEAYWARVTATQTGIELRYGQAVAGDGRVAVEWWATLLNDGAAVTLAGEFLLLFDEDGRCRELREYWAYTEGRIEPPDGWGT